MADRTSRQPIAASHGGPHVMVPFAIEDGGKLGAHTQALLRAMATFALAKRLISPVERIAADAPHPIMVSLWV